VTQVTRCSDEIKSRKRNRKNDKPRRERGDITGIPRPFDMFAWAREQDDLTTGQKHVLVNLATYADQKTGECYPDIDTQVLDTGMSRRTVFRRLEELEALGKIRREEQRKDDGTRAASHYILAGLLEARKPSATAMAPGAQPSVTGDQPSVTGDQPSATAMAQPSVTGGTTCNELANELANGTSHKDVEETPTSEEFSEEPLKDNPGGNSENGNPSPSGTESVCVEIEGLEIPPAKYAGWVRRFKFLPNLESEIASLAPWAKARGERNGGDWEGALLAALTKRDRKAALEREQPEREYDQCDQNGFAIERPQGKWGVNYL
jgi:hypothetical protein